MRDGSHTAAQEVRRNIAGACNLDLGLAIPMPLNIEKPNWHGMRYFGSTLPKQPYRVPLSTGLPIQSSALTPMYYMHNTFFAQPLIFRLQSISRAGLLQSLPTQHRFATRFTRPTTGQLTEPTMRKINVSKPAASKPASGKASNATRVAAAATKPAKAAEASSAKLPTVTVAVPASVAKPATTEAPAAAKPVRGVNATARTIAAAATHFGGLSDRDTAYLTFYAGIAKRGNGTVTVRDLATSEARPAYNGSNKPHDAGVIVRLTKAGLLNPSADGHSFTFTTAALTHAAYVAGK